MLSEITKTLFIDLDQISILDLNPVSDILTICTYGGANLTVNNGRSILSIIRSYKQVGSIEVEATSVN